jgi:branched-chain amino acid transport system substrate-binding protein
MHALVAAGHPVVVGPMTSAMAAVTVPLANQAGVLMVSPTVTSAALTGLDDQFFRVVSSVQDYARKSVAFHHKHHPWKRFAVILDDGNQDYSRGWLTHFEQALSAHGGQLVSTQGYVFERGMSFTPLAAQALASQPDAVLLLVGAVDAAQLAQALRKLAPAIPLVTSEWAATEQLLAMGGRAVEGAFTAQFLDRDSTSPSYQAFALAFAKRFGRRPGFAELAAYDAARVVLQALAVQQAGESLKATLLRVRRFEGVQQPVVFDDAGDARRDTIITTIRDGRFVAVPE